MTKQRDDKIMSTAADPIGIIIQKPENSQIFNQFE